MFTRDDIRYHTLWVRLLCCLAVGMSVWNAVYFDILSGMEQILRELLAFGSVPPAVGISERVEIGIVFLVCLIPAIPRFERPVAMVLGGIIYACAYLAIVVIYQLTAHRFLAISAPLLGVLGSTAVLETMAWSEERSRRRELERLDAARKQFTDMLVHDLRKRMSSILTSFSLLEGKFKKTDDDVSRLVNTIHAGSERMLILISNLLDIRKTEEEGMHLRLEEVSLRDLLHSSLNDHRAVGDLVGIRFRMLGDSDLRVRVDKHIFQRLLANLIWNALQYAPHDSEIQIGHHVEETGAAILYVANRGTPIPTEEQEMIFRAFVSGRTDITEHGRDSTGLGLAFCKLAMEAHGGNIELESPWQEHGDGVKVIVRLQPSA